MEDVVNAFNQEEDINDNELIQSYDPLQINYENYEILKVIKYFQQINS